MKKSDIPPDVAAKVLFQSDRTCCVCRIRGKPIQIHHIDGNKLNHDLDNLAVLCLDCHADTQVSGGFHRKLDADQVILYRNDWSKLVARERAVAIIDREESPDTVDIELLTTELEVLKDKKEYELLAMNYNIIGNAELRDKYIELALKGNKSAETEIYLRALQGKVELVDLKVVKNEINRIKRNKEWEQLARLYVDTKDWEKAIDYYCKGISESLEQGNIFAAAFYLKELSDKKLHNLLFEKSYKQFKKKRDLWWQVRSLQELGWDSELESLLISKKTEIEKSGDLLILDLLYRITGEKEKLIDVVKKPLC